MHTETSYKLSEFLDWTRRDIYVLVVVGFAAVVAYQVGNMKWVGIPWMVVALLGAATDVHVAGARRGEHREPV